MTIVKFKTIVKISKKIKTYVEKNHKLPGKITVDNVTYTYKEAGYLISKAVTKPGQDVKLIKVNPAPKLSGVTVNLKLDKKQYTSLAKKLSDFILKKGRLPNYLNYEGKHIRQRVFIYSFSKIIVWYDNHKNTLPGTCTFRTSETIKPAPVKIKKYGRSTKNGCDNRGQNTGYYCACHMAQEIVRNLTGKIIPQKTIAAVMGTTTSGTSHEGINTFFAWFNKKYGFNLKVEWKNFSDLGWKGIKKILESSNQDMGAHELYRDTWGHYTNFDKVYGSTVDVHNSLGSICSGTCYCGYTEPRSQSTAKRYLNGISQKSILVVTRTK